MSKIGSICAGIVLSMTIIGCGNKTPTCATIINPHKADDSLRFPRNSNTGRYSAVLTCSSQAPALIGNYDTCLTYEKNADIINQIFAQCRSGTTSPNPKAKPTIANYSPSRPEPVTNSPTVDPTPEPIPNTPKPNQATLQRASIVTEPPTSTIEAPTEPPTESPKVLEPFYDDPEVEPLSIDDDDVLDDE